MSPAQGSMICPQCGRLIGVSEEKCPFCGAWRPGMFGMAPKMQRWFGTRLDLIPVIFSACVVLYAASLLLDLSAITRVTGIFDIGREPPPRRLRHHLGLRRHP